MAIRKIRIQLVLRKKIFRIVMANNYFFLF